jgi:hypothetical protein
MRTLSVERLANNVYLVRYHPYADIRYTGVCVLVCREDTVIPKGFIMPKGSFKDLREQFKACIKAIGSKYKSERKWRAKQT